MRKWCNIEYVTYVFREVFVNVSQNLIIISPLCCCSLDYSMPSYANGWVWVRSAYIITLTVFSVFHPCYLHCNRSLWLFALQMLFMFVTILTESKWGFFLFGNNFFVRSKSGKHNRTERAITNFVILWRRGKYTNTVYVSSKVM